jgi:hypothetical protein
MAEHYSTYEKQQILTAATNRHLWPPLRMFSLLVPAYFTSWRDLF